MWIMALDPGGMTGIAIARMDVERRRLSDVSVSQFPMPAEGEDRWAWEMWQMIGKEGPDVLVVEDFRLFPNMQHGPDQSGTTPMRLNARLQMVAWLIKMEELEWDGYLPEIEMQMPGERSVVTDDELRKMGLWTTPSKGGGPHAMDALRHLIVFGRKLGKS